MNRNPWAQEVMSDNSSNVEQCRRVAGKPAFQNLLKEYEAFFHSVIDGKYGSTAAYWATYAYFINRLYRELQRAVRTNNVDGYISVLPHILDIFFL